ncbi:MAG TPA: T9SS type A sorting domain-containing protein [Ignavibacteriaceae bacterium]|nr:T9SS type A sorting domain-containing protein [Ignavibacteriaceae bacterium]
MKNASTFLLVSLFCFFFLASATPQSEVVDPPIEFAQFNIIPPEYSNVGGTTSFTGPLAATARTIQFLIHDSLLTGLIGKEIQGISFRLPVSATSNWPAAEVTYPSYDIYLSGSVTPSARSLTFANNIVGSQTQVRSGPLVIPADSYTFNQVPNDWGPQITFNNYWLYNGGHLLIEIRSSVTTGTSRSVDAIGTSITGYGTYFSACWASGSTATSGSQGNFCVLRLTSDDPIPVELTSFTANTVSNTVELKWITATELNNRGFEIQRKLNASEFESIGFINGNGTTTEESNYSFTDYNLSEGLYSYRLKQIDFDGTFEFSNEINIEINSPENFSLAQNYPNPFNPSTTIKYSIPNVISTGGKNLNVILKVFDVLGVEIATLVNEEKSAGNYEVNFNATSLSSGVYLYKIQAGSFVQTKKMLLIR